MEFTNITAGMRHKAEEIVTEKNTAVAMGSGSLPVYATPAMTCLMEKAAAELLEKELPEGWTSVGISLQIKHNAATPIGLKIQAEAELTEVDGRRFVFTVRAFDEREEIGCGQHERFAVATEKFLAKAASKKGE